MTAARLNDDWHRRMARLFQMVTELHKIGYQGLRVYPQIHHDRFHLVPSIFTTHPRAHGVMVDWDWGILGNGLPHNATRASQPSTSLAAVYYGNEQSDKTARESADIFVQLFPIVATLSLLDDYEYAGWFQRLTGEVEKGLRPLYARVDGEDWSDADLFSGSDSPDVDDGLSDRDNIPPTLVLMGQGYKRDVHNIVKTFPLPPLPKIDGGDLHRLVRELVALTPHGDFLKGV
jgi:hypothetical protein